MIISYFLLLVVWGFIVLGIGFQGYATFASYRDATYVTLGKTIFQRFIRPFWYLWIILALVVASGPFFLQSYYDYYAASINSQFFTSILLNSFFSSAIIIVLAFEGLRFNDKNLWIPVICGAVFLFLLAWLFTLPQINRQLKALISEPSYGNGVVQEKFWNGKTYYYIDVDGESFWTQDGNWYEDIHVGRELEFAYSPFTDSIFDPENTDFSVLGIAVVLCGCVFWFLGICLAFDGWLAVLSRHKAKPL